MINSLTHSDMIILGTALVWDRGFGLLKIQIARKLESTCHSMPTRKILAPNFGPPVILCLSKTLDFSLFVFSVVIVYFSIDESCSQQNLASPWVWICWISCHEFFALEIWTLLCSLFIRYLKFDVLFVEVYKIYSCKITFFALRNLKSLGYSGFWNPLISI